MIYITILIWVGVLIFFIGAIFLGVLFNNCPTMSPYEVQRLSWAGVGIVLIGIGWTILFVLIRMAFSIKV